MNELLDQLKENFKNEEARYAYADAVVNALISAQIKAQREDRQLSQEQLGALVGTKQSGISRLERADYSSWKVETLRKLARAFGLRLRIGGVGQVTVSQANLNNGVRKIPLPGYQRRRLLGRPAPRSGLPAPC